ncbi:MAG: citrate/2-methylcitrate synthase [Thermoleophilaceae bacterium]
MLATNVEFWSAVVLDFAGVPPQLFTPLFSSARVAGWSAHVLEQKREGRLIRPTAAYVGPGRGRGRRWRARRLRSGPRDDLQAPTLWTTVTASREEHRPWEI